MKKIILIVLISFAALFAVSQAPHPALCFTKTGQADPAFISVFLPIEGLDAGDWLGVYDTDNMLCYGSKPLKSDTVRAINIVCFGDEYMTEKKDGFSYGATMKLFMYDAGSKKFYHLSGNYISGYDDKPVTVIKWYSLAIYKAVNVKQGNEITLNTDPELSQVFLNFTDMDGPVNVSGKDRIKINISFQNTTEPTLIITSGKGKLVEMWDGPYYKYAPDDKNVIVNAVAKNNFTGAMLTDKLIYTLDLSNTVFEDDNILINIKGDEVWCKIKSEKVSLKLYRTDNGVEKLMWSSGSKVLGTETRFLQQYSRGWKGQKIRFVYYYTTGGKLNKTPVNGSFNL